MKLKADPQSGLINKKLVSLRNNNDFREVYRNGKSFANKYLVLYVLKNGLSVNRSGISVSKKVGNSVVRHRIKRLIRECIRLHGEEFLTGYDFVWIARAGIIGISYWEMESAVLHLGRLHKILKVKSGCEEGSGF
ncbi:MAG: ribonuclease P protein component [Lachnospiraceae bacterium]|nr:ribonuclease P protein component [Lachnospiraceae bacterium]